MIGLWVLISVLSLFVVFMSIYGLICLKLPIFETIAYSTLAIINTCILGLSIFEIIKLW